MTKTNHNNTLNPDRFHKTGGDAEGIISRPNLPEVAWQVRRLYFDEMREGESQEEQSVGVRICGRLWNVARVERDWESDVMGYVDGSCVDIYVKRDMDGSKDGSVCGEGCGGWCDRLYVESYVEATMKCLYCRTMWIDVWKGMWRVM